MVLLKNIEKCYLSAVKNAIFPQGVFLWIIRSLLASGTVRKWFMLPKPLEPSSGWELTGPATQIFGTNAGGDDEEDEDEEEDADNVMSWAAKWGKAS